MSARGHSCRRALSDVGDAHALPTLATQPYCLASDDDAVWIFMAEGRLGAVCAKG